MFKNKKAFTHHYFKDKNSAGFTLIELLIVIAIIAIIAAVVFVALDPLTRLRDARDSNRWTDITAIASAIKIDQVDNGGSYLSEITALATSTVYMIGTGYGCDNMNPYCDLNVTNTCVDLTGLVTEGYLGEVPVSPSGVADWHASSTGYTLEISTTSSSVIIRACESENSDEIRLVQ